MRPQDRRLLILTSITKVAAAALIAAFVTAGPTIDSTSTPVSDGIFSQVGFLPAAGANSSHANLAVANLGFSVNAGNPNQISSNDDWSGVPSVEGYFGANLTATHGVDPQTVLGTEFPGSSLPAAGQTKVAANKGNPNAFNAGGVAEFDSGTYLAIGLQGNVQANPYLVYYLNTTNRSSVTFSFDAIDIDGGSNNAVSPLAMQYRIGNTGPFTNVPAGFIADVSDGPNMAGRVTSMSAQLPANASNQPILQVRLITTNAANTSGGSTPDEWIGVNNVSVSSVAPSAANVDLGGRVMSGKGGRGVSGAVVTLLDEFGNSHSAVTNAFGYYQFTDLRAASTVVISVRSKRYVFDTQVVTLYDSFSDIDFFAAE